MSISANDFSQENAESDSDTNSDAAAGADDYQPISPFDEGDSDIETPIEMNGPDLISDSSEYHSLPFQNPNFRNFPNGFHQAENGISALNLNGSDNFNGCDETDDTDDDVVEAEEEKLRESEVAISRAFTEDERRRNAPLTPENTSRIVDAMRGVSFQGFPPDWADRVSEDQLVDQLRGLRESKSQN